MKLQSQRRFQEQILRVMDRKHHWAWPYFSSDALSKAQLKIHFQQEYAVYVRDFPVFLARIHGQNPPAEARRMLAENIYEEDTGGLSLGHAHPELFMSMMEGLGYQRKHFEKIALLPASLPYRRWLDRVSMSRDWVIGTAALTIFVEGSIKDRQEMQHPPKPKSKGEIEEYIQQHPLVQHHGLSPHCMDLIRAHQMVESGHRHDAHTMVLKYAVTSAQQNAVLACLNKSLRLWLRYRDAVARACKLNPA